MKTRIINIDPISPDEGAIKSAARILRAGGLIIFPTETVYGIGGDGANREVVERIYSIKGRSARKPLVRLIAGWKELGGVRFRPEHRALAEHFWPGPLTLILKMPDGSRQGFRFPDHELSRRLIRESDLTLVATSANRSGEDEVKDGREAQEKFGGGVDLILDGGRVGGKPSTVLDLTVSPEWIRRAGPVLRETIEKFLGHAVK